MHKILRPVIKDFFSINGKPSTYKFKYKWQKLKIRSFSNCLLFYDLIGRYYRLYSNAPMILTLKHYRQSLINRTVHRSTMFNPSYKKRRIKTACYNCFELGHSYPSIHLSWLYVCLFYLFKNSSVYRKVSVCLLFHLILKRLYTVRSSIYMRVCLTDSFQWLCRVLTLYFNYHDTKQNPHDFEIVWICIMGWL